MGLKDDSHPLYVQHLIWHGFTQLPHLLRGYAKLNNNVKSNLYGWNHWIMLNLKSCLLHVVKLLSNNFIYTFIIKKIIGI